MDLSRFVQAQEAAHVELQDNVARLDSETKRLIEEERHLQDLVMRCFPAGAKRGAPFVVSPRGVAHIPASRFYPEMPAHEWTARCGWSFAFKPYQAAAALRPDVKLCRSCCRRPAGTDDGDLSADDA